MRGIHSSFFDGLTTKEGGERQLPNIGAIAYVRLAAHRAAVKPLASARVGSSKGGRSLHTFFLDLSRTAE